MSKKRIVITGGAGTIGQILAERWAGTYDLVLTDLEEAATDEAEVDPADVDSLAAQRDSMRGADAVVHLAGNASPEATWDEVLEANIVGTRNVLEAARQAGVPRVVFASTNHVMGMYDRHSEWPVMSGMPQRPDSFYGVSKAFGETLGRFYHDEFGLEFIALRIGWSTEQEIDDPHELLTAMWLSPDDTAQVFRCAIEADVTYGVYYAVSDNHNRRWDITTTMLDLGYRPQDAYHRTHGITEEIIPGGHRGPVDWPVG